MNNVIYFEISKIYLIDNATCKLQKLLKKKAILSLTEWLLLLFFSLKVTFQNFVGGCIIINERNQIIKKALEYLLIFFIILFINKPNTIRND